MGSSVGRGSPDDQGRVQERLVARSNLQRELAGLDNPLVVVLYSGYAYDTSTYVRYLHSFRFVFKVSPPVVELRRRLGSDTFASVVSTHLIVLIPNAEVSIRCHPHVLSYSYIVALVPRLGSY